MKRRWPAVFRVYPGEGHPSERRPPGERYVGVRVYKTPAAMKRAVTTWCPAATVESGAVGITVQTERWYVKRGQFDQRSPEHVTVFLSKEYIDTETVAHEMGHVALILARDDGLRLHLKGGPADTHEESFCYMLGRLVRGFWENNPLVKRVSK